MEDGRRDIRERTFRFAVRIVKMTRSLGQSGCDGVMSRQIVRCGTSIGANVEEAQGAQSKKDFVRRMNIARAEAHEAHYWLRLLRETETMTAQQLEQLIDEADQLVRILTSIVKNSRERQ